MRIQLPVETWIEILDWLKRRDFIKKLDKLWDQQFTPIVQDWLHKYTRNVKLGDLYATDRGLGTYSSGKWEKLPLVDVDFPENITSFKLIIIRYLDSNVLTLLRQMRPLHNIHLVIIMMNRSLDHYYDDSLHGTVFRTLMPIFGNDSIESICFDLTFLPFFSTNYPSTLLNAKLLQIWCSQVLSAEESEQIMFDWLFTKREDGHARILVFHWTNNTANSQLSAGLCEKIREHFMDTARQCACPFFIRIWIKDFLLPTNIPNAENVRTDEQLIFKDLGHNREHYRLITNCPTNTSAEWLDEKTEEVLEWNFSKQQQQKIMLELEISPQVHAAEDDANQQRASGSGMKLI